MNANHKPFLVVLILRLNEACEFQWQRKRTHTHTSAHTYEMVVTIASVKQMRMIADGKIKSICGWAKQEIISIHVPKRQFSLHGFGHTPSGTPIKINVYGTILEVWLWNNNMMSFWSLVVDIQSERRHNVEWMAIENNPLICRNGTLSSLIGHWSLVIGHWFLSKLI